VAENLLLRQQLIMLRRSRRRAPNLSPVERLLAGACSILLYPRRLARAAVIFRPSTLLGIHRALVRRKYRNLFRSQRCHRKPGPPGPSPELVHVIVETKERNPRFGCPRIASQVARVFGIEVDKDLVRRVLAKHYRPDVRGSGPSWLARFGTEPNGLWSADLFCCESVLLKTHWVMVVMDQFSRRIVGFAVQVIAIDGTAVCRMFNVAWSAPESHVTSARTTHPISGSTNGVRTCGFWGLTTSAVCLALPLHTHLSSDSSELFDVSSSTIPCSGTKPI